MSSYKYKPTKESIVIFYAYAYQDERRRKQLETHMSLLRQQGLITEWYDRLIAPGTDWKQAIDTHLSSASIILLLVSPDFLASDYCYGVEMRQALECHKQGKVRVIPILLRPADWESAPFAHLQYLPRNGKPVTSWTNRDEAFADIVKGIREIIEEMYSLSSDGNSFPFLPISSSAPATTQAAQHNVTVQDNVPDKPITPGYQTTYQIKQRPLNFLAWIINLLSAGILSIILQFITPSHSIPLISYVQQNQFTALIFICGIVLLTLIGSFIIFRLNSLNNQQPSRQYIHSWGIITGTSTTSFVLCFSLLVIVLLRPSWCPMSLCPPPIQMTVKSGIHDKHLDVYFNAFQSASFAIPGNPNHYPQATLPIGSQPSDIGASLIDKHGSSSLYRVAIGVHSLEQGSNNNIIIEHATIIIVQKLSVPHPLTVRILDPYQDYSAHPYTASYREGLRDNQILAISSSTPPSHVQLLPGEGDQLDIQLRSRVPVTLQFRVQVDYHVSDEVQQHTLLLPLLFEAIFSNNTNWKEYQPPHGTKYEN